MPRISTIHLNPEDLILLIMMIIGVVITAHIILLAVTQSIQPTTSTIPKPVVVGLIAP
jgi:hypothetical protein